MPLTFGSDARPQPPIRFLARCVLRRPRRQPCVYLPRIAQHTSHRRVCGGRPDQKVDSSRRAISRILCDRVGESDRLASGSRLHFRDGGRRIPPRRHRSQSQRSPFASADRRSPRGTTQRRCPADYRSGRSLWIFGQTLCRRTYSRRCRGPISG